MVMPKDQLPGPWWEEFRKASGIHLGPAVQPPGRGEGRQHPRFLIFNAAVRLFLKRPGTLFGLLRKGAPGTAIDPSEGGARISTEIEIPVDTPVQIRIDIEKFKDRITSDGLVRWCRINPANPSGHQVGIMFMGLDLSEEKKIGLMRKWFTSDYCREFRERRHSPDRNSPVPADRPVAMAPSPLTVESSEVGKRIWAVTPKGNLEGSNLDLLTMAMDGALNKEATSLILDLKDCRLDSSRGFDRFFQIVDAVALRGIRIVFVAVPLPLRDQFDQRKERRRNFSPDVGLARALLSQVPRVESPRQ
jgi:hypothetical protein